MTEKELKLIQEYLIYNVFRNPDVFWRCVQIDTSEGLDVSDVIAGLFDLLHLVVTGDHYDYMWHWANKIGGWCEDCKLYDVAVKGESDGKET